MKATRRTKDRAKKLGLKVTIKRGSKRVPKTEEQLKKQVSNASKKKKTVSKKTKRKPIPKLANSTVKKAARVLGSRGGKKAARNKKKK